MQGVKVDLAIVCFSIQLFSINMFHAVFRHVDFSEFIGVICWQIICCFQHLVSAMTSTSLRDQAAQKQREWRQLEQLQYDLLFFY